MAAIAIAGIQYDQTYMGIDKSSGSLQVIDYAHHEIHGGSSFVVSDVDLDVDAAGPKYWRITTPNTTKWAHFTGSLAASGAGTIEFFENPTLTGAGTGLTAYNRNRNSATAATLVVAYDATASADGTRIFLTRVSSGGIPARDTGGSIDVRSEFILKQNEDYLLKFTADADNTKVWVTFEWYEHANKIS